MSMSRRGIASLRLLRTPATRPAARLAAVTAPLLSRSLHTSPRLNDNMRCVLIKDGKGPVENLYLGEEPTPTPKKGEVLVKVG